MFLESVAPDLVMSSYLLTKAPEIEKQIGKGGFGVVYKATMDNEVVAVKELILKEPESDSENRMLKKFMEFKHEVAVMRYNQ